MDDFLVYGSSFKHCLKNLETVDESKTHIFLSPFFKYILGLKVQFNVKLWNFHTDLCFARN